jgi:hypothetical protein
MTIMCTSGSLAQPATPRLDAMRVCHGPDNVLKTQTSLAGIRAMAATVGHWPA